MIWTSPEHGTFPVRVNVETQGMLLADLRKRLVAGEGFSVATINLDHVVKLRNDPSFRWAYSMQTHVTADGRPIVWCSCLAGDDVALVTGSDLVFPIVELCAELSLPIAFLGATDTVLEKAAASLRTRYPKLEIVKMIAPPMGFDPESAQADAFITSLAASGARVCLLALGAPKQEVLAARALSAHPRLGFLSIGAGLDFLAGTQVRAPRLVRALAAEWLWRLVKNPRRLATRYGACLAILPGLILRALQIRRSRADQSPTERNSS